MAETADSKIVALPAIVDLDALDFVRDGLIEAVELGPVTVDASNVDTATNALFLLISAAERHAYSTARRFPGSAHQQRSSARARHGLLGFDERIVAHACTDGRRFRTILALHHTLSNAGLSCSR
jgi:hypothetical protein